MFRVFKNFKKKSALSIQPPEFQTSEHQMTEEEEDQEEDNLLTKEIIKINNKASNTEQKSEKRRVRPTKKLHFRSSFCNINLIKKP